MPEPTVDELRHLRDVHQGRDPVHPFTAMRFVALGWWVQETPSDCFSGLGGSFRLTDAGRAALRHTPTGGSR